MPRRVHEEDLRVIEVAVRQHPDGLTAQQIDDALQSAPPRRTLQYRLKSLVTSKRLVMEGTGRWARYRAPRAIFLTADFVAPPATTSATLDVLPPLSEAAMAIREHLRRPTVSRTPVGYDREFLDSYRPNETFYLSESDRALLQNIGRPKTPQHQPAGTYAKRLLDRLLLDRRPHQVLLGDRVRADAQGRWVQKSRSLEFVVAFIAEVPHCVAIQLTIQKVFDILLAGKNLHEGDNHWKLRGLVLLLLRQPAILSTSARRSSAGQWLRGRGSELPGQQDGRADPAPAPRR